MTALEYVPAVWTCRGRRWTASKGKLYTVWADPDGAERWWEKITGVTGGRYDVEVAEAPDGSGLYLRVKGYLDQAEDLDAVRAWQVQDRAAQAAQAAYRLERNAKRQGELDDALAPVLAVAGRLRTYADREALARYIAAQIHGAA